MKWDRKIGLTLATVVVLFGATGAPSAKAQAAKPNIVFILVDNTGWGDWRVYGGTTATPRIDGEYLIPKTVDYIKRQAASKKPFFVYLGYSEMHPPTVCNPAFVGKSPLSGGMYSDCIAEMDYRVGQVLDAIKEAIPKPPPPKS